MFTRRERARISEDIKDVLERPGAPVKSPWTSQALSRKGKTFFIISNPVSQMPYAHDRRFLQTFQELGVSKAELLDRWGLPKVRLGCGSRTVMATLCHTRSDRTDPWYSSPSSMGAGKGSTLQLASRLPLSKQSQVPSQALQKRLSFFVRGRVSKRAVGECMPRAGENMSGIWPNNSMHLMLNRSIRGGTPESDLDILEESLRELRADRLVHHELLPLRRHLEVLLYMARLDIRQNSAYHEKALIQLLRAGGCPEAEQFGDMDELERQAFLNQELTRLRPLASPRAELPEEAAMTVRSLSVIADHWIGMVPKAWVSSSSA